MDGGGCLLLWRSLRGVEHDLILGRVFLLQREMPVSEQLGQIKDAAKGKINEFVDQSNIKFEQAKNDPSNK